MSARRRQASAAVGRGVRPGLAARGAALLAAAFLAAAAPGAPASGPKAGPSPARAAAGPVGTFPRDFLWGFAVAGFQYEMGGSPANLDRRSNWWAWVHDPANLAAGRVAADARPERGPAGWNLYRRDIDLAKRLGAGAFRFSVEWRRIFPESTAGIDVGRRITAADLRRLDRVADQSAVRHYRAVATYLRSRDMEPLVTLHHWTLPLWLDDPLATRDALAARGPDDPLPALRRAGWLQRSTVTEFRKLAAYVAWKLGDRVDVWNPINEPLVIVANGYVNVPGAFAGNFPPGAFSFTAAIAAARNLVRANAAAYDAVKALDRGARVGLVQNLIAFTPADRSSPRDRAGARHADYLFNRLFLNAAIRGRVDDNGNGRIEPAEIRPEQAGKADFLGVNYYFRGRVTGIGVSLSERIPIIDFTPGTGYRTALAPSLPPCPTTCSGLGSEIYPKGFRQVLELAGRYGLPVYITENGVADATDALRPRFLVEHLRVLRKAMADGVVDARGYFHWSLIDNLEWVSGYEPKFGLCSYDADTLRRSCRPSSYVFAGIARSGKARPRARRGG